VKITVQSPEVAYPGGHSHQHYMRTAARNLRQDFPAGGSNVRASIASLLDRVADAMDAAPDLTRAPDGRSVHEDLTAAERRALPGAYHQPYWDGCGDPHLWLCTVCYDDGEVNGWPCDTATREGKAAAKAGGLSYSS
jgi:hypothetical protein